jgi:thiamine-monophosphate kinase
MNETEIISSLLPKITNENFLKNDAFIFDKFIITKDVLVEGKHFFKGSDPKNLAKKALRVNLSDVASMGAQPIGYFLGLVLNENSKKRSWLENFISGLDEDQKKYGLQLFGGDTVIHDGEIVISITMIGENKGRALNRSGAKPGDLICVSGSIGDSYLGLLSYQQKIGENIYFKEKYDLPDPKVELGVEISKFATSCIDISDGLMLDANHIAKNSSVMMEINIDQIPFSLEAKKLLNFNLELKKDMITAGDDYELLFTIPEKNITRINKLKIFQIGFVKEGLGVKLINSQQDTVNIEKLGFIHK